MTGTSQIIDLNANGKNNFTPAYAIYEKGKLSKVALINFMDDKQKGTNNLEVTLQLPNGAPRSVQVKYVETSPSPPFGDWLIDPFLKKFYRYLSATSVSDRDNITWAGQVNKKRQIPFSMA